MTGYNGAGLHELAAPEERPATPADAAGVLRRRVPHRGLSQEASARSGVVEPDGRAGAQRLAGGATVFSISVRSLFNADVLPIAALHKTWLPFLLRLVEP